MSTNVSHEEDAHRFVLDLGKEEAVLNYRMDGEDVINLTYTEVPKGHEGEGIGSKLAKAAVEFARSNELRIRPTCGFVRSWLDKHPEHSDLVAS